MTSFKIVYSQEANTDLERLFQLVVCNYQAPFTAYRYIQGIIDVIKGLAKFPESLPVQTSAYYLRFGTNVRRINYKKMAVIYGVYGNVVYIHRIIPASMITS